MTARLLAPLALRLLILGGVGVVLGWLALTKGGFWEALAVGILVGVALLSTATLTTFRYVESAWQPMATKATVNLAIAADYAQESAQLVTTSLTELQRHDPETARVLAKRAFDLNSRFQEMT